MSFCSGVTHATGENPWRTRGMVASAATGAITLIVCSVLAILVSQQVMTFPAQLSVTNLLIAGLSTATLCTLLAIALKCCRKRERPKGGEGSGVETTPKDKKKEEPIGGNNTGALGSSSKKKSFQVKEGSRQDLL